MKTKIILVSILLTSCSNPKACPEVVFDTVNRITTTTNGDLYTGRCSMYANDTLRSIQQYLNGKDYGLWVFYFSDGSTETKGSFNKNGQRIGKWKYYHENGEHKQIARYSKDGDRTGKWTWYDKEGNIENEASY